MKLLNLIKNIKKPFKSSKGESMMEVLVSLLMLGILLTSVVTIVSFSMGLTTQALTNATATQDAFNRIRTLAYAGDDSTTTSVLAFTITGTDSSYLTPGISPNHSIRVASAIPNVPNTIAFMPASADSGGGGGG